MLDNISSFTPSMDLFGPEQGHKEDITVTEVIAPVT